MKKLQLASLLAAACVAAPIAAQAETSIHFNGQLLDVTCTITTGTNGNQTISLGNMAVSSLAGPVGTKAGGVPFQISITGCGSNVTTVTPWFSSLAGNTNVDSTGNMVNTATASAASGVVLQMSNDVTSSSNIDLKGQGGAQNVDTATITGGAATNFFKVNYLTTGTVTAGAFNAAIAYSLSYN